MATAAAVVALPHRPPHLHTTRLLHASSFPNVARFTGTTRTSVHLLFTKRTRTRGSSTDKEEAGVSSSGEKDSSVGSSGDGGTNWITNAPVFLLWAGLIGYAFSSFSPNQTPYRDQLFIEKLLFLRGEEGFSLNPVLVFVFYSMGLLPLIYTMLLIPTGRSEKGGIPVWPFSLVSYFVGAFALLPYFGLWNPPPPKVARRQLSEWPLVALESKLLSLFATASAVGLVAKAALCNSEAWTQYFSFFRESRFIHVMTIDFVLLNLLVVFWVFNDITFRKWSKGSWFTAISIVPLVGPAIYLLFRPGLPKEMIED